MRRIVSTIGLSSLWRWFRTWPQPHWNWPYPTNLDERDRLGLTAAPAYLLPRLLLSNDDEVQIVNSGDGAARDVVVHVLILQRPQRTLIRAADSPVIGARSGYIVDLHDAVLPVDGLPDGVWVHCTWCNHDETVAESWAQQNPQDSSFVETASPLG